MGSIANAVHRGPWKEGKIVGRKSPFKLKEIWAFRVRLQMEHLVRELALFEMSTDAKLCGCDLVTLRVHHVCHGGLQTVTKVFASVHGCFGHVAALQ